MLAAYSFGKDFLKSCQGKNKNHKRQQKSDDNFDNNRRAISISQLMVNTAAVVLLITVVAKFLFSHCFCHI